MFSIMLGNIIINNVNTIRNTMLCNDIRNNIFILFLSKNHIRLFEGPISNLLSSRFERVNRPFLKSISELSK